MSYMPPDARTPSDFEILRGLGDTIYRIDSDIKDINDLTTGLPASVTVGTPVKYIAGHDEEVFITSDTTMIGATIRGHVVGVYEAGMVAVKEPDRFAGFCHSDYDSSLVGGMPDANFRDAITVLAGEYIAKINEDMFDLTSDFVITLAGPVLLAQEATLTVGQDVVMVNHVSSATAAGTGMFCALDMDYSAGHRYVGVPTAAEMAVDNAVIGKIIKIADGFVHVRISC